jgi:hypothetical protein
MPLAHPDWLSIALDPDDIAAVAASPEEQLLAAILLQALRDARGRARAAPRRGGGLAGEYGVCRVVRIGGPIVRPGDRAAGPGAAAPGRRSRAPPVTRTASLMVNLAMREGP